MGCYSLVVNCLGVNHWGILLVFCKQRDFLLAKNSQYSSLRIQRLYNDRGEKRDHSRDTAVKHATGW